MRRPLLVACDVDGTLLDAEGYVSPRNRAAVGRVIASGTPFVLVSGRPPRWITNVAETVGAAGYAVCCNGAVGYDIGTDRVRAARAMRPSLLYEVGHTLARVLPGSRLAVERVGMSARDPDVLPFVIEQGYIHPWGDADPATAPRAGILGQPAVKLLVRCPSMTSGELYRAAAAALVGRVDITFSAGGGLLEISAPGVTKASGLARVSRRLGVAAADVLAFGDMPNDLTMLEWAGHGVAMANAHAEVAAAADEVTATNSEDGVAQLLERWW